MNNYLNFFSPQTISILFCLLQANTGKESEESQKLLEFCIHKIMHMNQEASQSSMEEFQAELMSLGQDQQLINFRLKIEKITSLNTFYKALSETLKDMRKLRSARIQQSGNIIELFIRRVGVYFQRMDFHELVGIFNDFKAYRDGQPVRNNKLNDFLVSRRLEQLKFGLENYSGCLNYEQTDKELEKLQKMDPNCKAFYLKALNEVKGGKPLVSMDSMHKYFDKSLCNLFSQRGENMQQGNNVNHCILNLAYLNLKLGFVDEALKSISQGLRISQNNSDEESINHCIIYLYQITQALGMPTQQILLTEHAINHCLNLNNTLLMLFSCFQFSQLEKQHDCSVRQLDPQKSRQLSWIDALHFAKKKIYSNFQNCCKTIFHSQRSLMVPVLLHKLAVINQLPLLADLLLQGLKQDPQVKNLDQFKLALENTQVDGMIREATLSDCRGEHSKTARLYEGLLVMAAFQRDPKEIIKIWAFRNKSLIKNGRLVEAYDSCQRLISFCQAHGYVKGYLVDQQLNIIKIQQLSGNYVEALMVAEQVLATAEQLRLTEQMYKALIFKASLHFLMNNLTESLYLLKTIEQSGQLSHLPIDTRASFQETKANVLVSVWKIIQQQGCWEDANQLATQIEHLFTGSIKNQLELFNFIEVSRLCKQWRQWCINSQIHKDSLTKTIDYLQQVFRYMAGLNLEYQYREKASEELSSKIRFKLQRLLAF